MSAWRQRLLLITGRADVGGGPEHVLQLARGLQSHYQVALACPREAPYWGRYQAVLGEDAVSEIPRRSAGPATVMRLRNILKERSPDLVHTHGLAAGLCMMAQFFVGRRPIWLHTHHGLHHRSSQTLVARRIKQALLGAIERATDTTIYVSQDEQAYARQHGLAEHATAVIPNGVATPAIALLPTAPAAGDHRQRLRVLTVTRYNRQKNPAGLLAIIAAAQDQAPLEFHVYGDGPGRREFQQQLAARSLEPHAHVHGAVEDLTGPLEACDVFLSCSLWEGLPLAVLEAMARGKPAVLSQGPGHDVLIAAKQGVVGFDPDHPSAAVEQLMTHHSTRYRQTQGNAARRLVEQQYSEAVMLASLRNQYDALLSAAAGRGG